MLKILIVDDEPPARSRLKRLLEPIPACTVVGETASGEEALALLPELTPHLLLLDISMPGLDGMALARQLKVQEPAPAVVFCTAWPDQALDAFECDAIDYLLKPVRRERLEAALDKVRRVMAVAGSSAAGPFLRSAVGGKVTLVPLAEVICLLAEDKYTTVVHQDGQAVIDQSLVELEKKFPGQWLRIHRNSLVAPSCIRGLDRELSGSLRLVLEGTDFRPDVSRRNIANVRQILREMG